MKLAIQKLIITNFKGIRSLEVDFKNITNIEGHNGTGKTSVFDAFNWLLFGKDSHHSKDFNIKNTVDTSLNKMDHEVTGVFDVDGSTTTFKRVYSEKWTTKRGTSDREMTGHETKFFYNDIPLSQAEYNAKVDSIIKEDLAKLLTNPTHFNTIEWKKRRSVLIDIAGQVSDADILASIKGGMELAEILKGGKSLDEFKKEIAAKKKKAKEQLETIPTRIDEANRSKPEVVDFDSISKQIETKKAEITKIDAAIEDKSKASDAVYKEIQTKQGQINDLQNKIREIKTSDMSKKNAEISSIEDQIQKLRVELSPLSSSVTIAENEIKSNEQLIEKNDKDAEVLRKQWMELNEKTLVIDPNDTCCPTCTREFDSEKVEDIKAKLSDNFNQDKVRRLNDMNTRGVEINSRSISLKNRNGELLVKIEDIKKRQDELVSSIEALVKSKEEAQNKSVVASPEIEVLNNQITEITNSIPTNPTADNSEYTLQKKTIQSEIDGLNIQLATKDQLAKINTRIAELEREGKELAQIIADYEQQEFVANDFTKKKMDEIETRVNGKFSTVKFRMFETQINGGEAECCDCLVNGVPFSDANTAGRILAGLEILSVLSDHYKVYAPVWIDNREAIVEPINCDLQLINMRAVEQTKKQLIIN